MSLIWFVTNFYVQKVLLRPILKLSSTIDNVMKSGYYRKKLVEHTYDDEIGVLYHNFNSMMQQIEKTTVSKNYLDSIMSALAEMIIVLDIDGRINYINEAVEKTTGYSYKELKGKKTSFLISNFKEKKTDKNFEETINTKYDKPVFVMASTTCFYTKEGYEREILSIRNISEQKKAEAKVKKYYNALEASNAELAQKNQALEHFTMVASHDMKSPLRTISSFITLIERKLSKNQNEELNEYITFVKNGANHLYKLIVDTLEYAQVGSKAIDFELVNTQNLMTDIKHFVGDKATVNFDNLPDVISNKNLMHKLFQNIVENGIKYNENELKTISITHKVEDENVIFAIQDNGIGIDEKYYKIIFEQHRRLHNNEKYKGTGLGLAICSRVTEQLKGEIWLTSQLNVGSTFYIKLPKKN
ncbi:MAG: ATP-binding protein [Saprospiraceae bacterium]